MGDFQKLKFLLDTHIWIWGLMNPEKFSGKVISEIENSNNEIWLSSISVWEALILIEKRRLVLNIPAEEWIRRAVTQLPIYEAPLTIEVALKSRAMQLPHQEPADRFIAATALVHGFTLITSDERIARSNDISILFN